jgi:hypothetical protein
LVTGDMSVCTVLPTDSVTSEAGGTGKGSSDSGATGCPPMGVGAAGDLPRSAGDSSANGVDPRESENDDIDGDADAKEVCRRVRG